MKKASVIKDITKQEIMLKRLLHIVKNFNNDSEGHYDEVISGIERVLAKNSEELKSAKKRSNEIGSVIKALELDKKMVRDVAKSYLKVGNEVKAQQILEEEKVFDEKIKHQEILQEEMKKYIHHHESQVQSVQLKLERLKSKQALMNSGTDGIKNLKAASEQIDDALNSGQLQDLELEIEALDYSSLEEQEIERALEGMSSSETDELQREMQLEEEERRQKQKEQRNRMFERRMGSIENKPRTGSNKKYEKLIEFKNTQSKKDDRNEELLASFKESDGFHQQHKIKEFFSK